MSQHKHNEDCYLSADGYKEYLIHVAPSFLWANVQDVGACEGTVFGVAFADGKIALFEEGYGSCRGCGAWGEGGEPEDEDAVRANSKFFDDPMAAMQYVNAEWNGKYNTPDLEEIRQAINEIAYRFLKLNFDDRRGIQKFVFTKEEN